MSLKDIPIFDDHNLITKIRGKVCLDVDSLPSNFYLSPSYIMNGVKMEIIEFSVIPIPDGAHMIIPQDKAVVHFAAEAPVVKNAIMSLVTNEE